MQSALIGLLGGLVGSLAVVAGSLIEQRRADSRSQRESQEEFFGSMIASVFDVRSALVARNSPDVSYPDRDSYCGGVS